MKYLFFIVGLISVGLGLVGTIIPGIPTTPLLLLSAWCFSKSSKRLELWILNNDLTGTIIKNWRDYKGLSRKSKIFSILVIIPSFYLSCHFISNTLIDIILIITCITLCLYLITRPEPPEIQTGD